MAVMSKRLNRYEFALLAWKLIIKFPIALVFNSVRIIWIAWVRRLPMPTYLLIAVVRSFLTTLLPREIQFLLPTTDHTIVKWVSVQQSVARRTDDSALSSHTELRYQALPLSKAALHWLGLGAEPPSSSSKVLLFLHGGGYAVPLGDAHLDWSLEHIQRAHATGIKLAVAVLEYSLAPAHQYPTQLSQAAEALKTILALGFDPSNIIIGGDSAGGHLTFALISHILNPHPEVETIQLAKPLAGAFGISPWVSMDMKTESYRENSTVDMLSPSLVRQSGADLLAGTNWRREITSGFSWSMPLECSSLWWKGVSTCAQRVFLNAGDQEMFHDQVLQFSSLLVDAYGNSSMVTLDIGKKEAHDHVLTEFMRKNRGGRSVLALMDWMVQCFE